MEQNMTLSEFIKYLKALEYDHGGSLPIVIRGSNNFSYGFNPMVSRVQLAKNDNKFVSRKGRDAFVVDIR